jgi:DNA-binding MarR family transcriptional regulator
VPWLLLRRAVRASIALAARPKIRQYVCKYSLTDILSQGPGPIPPMPAPAIADADASASTELANRLFFRLYQCANMLHKTGSRAVEDEGLTTQQWAVLGALSRPQVPDGMGVGELARYLMVSRQNLSGLLARMERAGHVTSAPDGRDRRARRVTMTASGRRVWQTRAQPKIRAYYDAALAGFSVNDMAHTLHYLLKMLDNMQRIDDAATAPPTAAPRDVRGKAPRVRRH